MGGAILVHFTPKGETVNSQNCCDVTKETEARNLKISAVQNWLKTRAKKFFPTELKNL
jgi:hypothetical protein